MLFSLEKYLNLDILCVCVCVRVCGWGLGLGGGAGSWCVSNVERTSNLPPFLVEDWIVDVTPVNNSDSDSESSNLLGDC